MALSWPFAHHAQEWYGDLAPGAFWDFPVLFIFLYCFLASVLCVVIGVGMLKGRNWSRFLALGYCFVGLFMGFMWFDVSPLLLLNFFINLAFTVIMGLYLFGPKANAFFAGGGAPQQDPVEG